MTYIYTCLTIKKLLYAFEQERLVLEFSSTSKELNFSQFTLSVVH